MLVAYLNKPSEEAIFESNRIKEQHEIKNSTNQQSETSQEKAICII